MAESAPDAVDTAKRWTIFALILASLAIGGYLLLKYYNNMQKLAKDSEESEADKNAANALATQLSMDQGRALQLISIARSLDQEINHSTVYVSSSKCVSLLNQVTTAQEMQALCTLYNVNVTNGKNLKADVDQHVIGWGTSASAINHYGDMTA